MSIVEITRAKARETLCKTLKIEEITLHEASFYCFARMSCHIKLA